MNSPTENPEAKRSFLWLALYYLLIILAVILLHGRGGLEAPSFIYQGF